MPRHAAVVLAAQDLVEPTPERQNHNPVHRLPRPIADTEGGIALPYRAADTLTTMHAAGSITSAMMRAGEEFRITWARAHLEALRAQPLLRMPAGKTVLMDDITARAEYARKRIWRAIQAVGGITSPAGSCLWHVIGLEQPLKEWAQAGAWNNRNIHVGAAGGILVAALGALAAHWNIEK